SEGLKEGSENPLTFANVQMAQRIMRESILATGCLHGCSHGPNSGIYLAREDPEILTTNGLQLVGRTGLEPDPLRVMSSQGVQRRSPAFNSSSPWEISSAEVWHHSCPFKVFASGIADIRYANEYSPRDVAEERGLT